jgi:hypothetical protein
MTQQTEIGSPVMKRTIIVVGGTAGAALRLDAARHGWHGVEIRSIEQVAARLAGGFLQPIDGEVLGNAAAEAIAALPAEELGDLGDIADLPGLPMALASTLSKVWHADIELSTRARLRPDVPRLATLARLEAAVIERLPHAMLTPTALARRAIARVAHAPRILGPIECRFLPDLAPCWRPLVIALSQVGSVTWNAGRGPAFQVSSGARLGAGRRSEHDDSARDLSRAAGGDLCDGAA